MCFLIKKHLDNKLFLFILLSNQVSFYYLSHPKARNGIKVLECKKVNLQNTYLL